MNKYWLETSQTFLVCCVSLMLVDVFPAYLALSRTKWWDLRCTGQRSRITGVRDINSAWIVQKKRWLGNIVTEAT